MDEMHVGKTRTPANRVQVKNGSVPRLNTHTHQWPWREKQLFAHRLPCRLAKRSFAGVAGPSSGTSSFKCGKGRSLTRCLHKQLWGGHAPTTVMCALRVSGDTDASTCSSAVLYRAINQAEATVFAVSWVSGSDF